MLRKTPPPASGRERKRTTEKRKPIATEKSEERKRVNERGTETSDKRKRGKQKKNGKERAAGEEQIEVVFVLSHRAGRPPEVPDIS